MLNNEAERGYYFSLIISICIHDDCVYLLPIHDSSYLHAYATYMLAALEKMATTSISSYSHQLTWRGQVTISKRRVYMCGHPRPLDRTVWEYNLTKIIGSIAEKTTAAYIYDEYDGS
jgi:hypothetical protein